MKDKEFLQWIHDRLEHQFFINKDTDYMSKFRSIISDYPEDKITPNVPKGNVLNYEKAFKDAETSEQWTEEAVNQGEIDPCFKGELNEDN